MTSHETAPRLSIPRPVISLPTTDIPLLPVFVSMGILALIFLQSPNFLRFVDADSSPFAGDFLQEWIGGYVVRTVGAERLFDEQYVISLQHDPALLGFRWEESRYFAMVYPPFYYILVSPFSWLPYRLAAWVFSGLMVVCLAATILMLRNAAQQPAGVDATCRGTMAAHHGLLFWLIPLAVLFVPVIRSLTTGQKGTLLLLILTGTYVLLNTRRPFYAGMVFGLLAFKPQLTLVIGPAMLMKRQWSFIAGTLATGIIAAGMCLMLGLNVCWQYLEFCTRVTEYVCTSGYDLHHSHCLYGSLMLLGGGEASLAIKVATALAGVLTVGMLCRMLRGPLVPNHATFDLQFSALVLGTILLSPHLFTYDLAILLLPMYLLVIRQVHGVLSSRPGLVLGWLVGGLYLTAGFSHKLAAIAGLQLTTLLICAVLWALVEHRKSSGWHGLSAGPSFT